MGYPKFKNKEECAFPKRLDCNGDTEDTKLRCPFMKYNNSASTFISERWNCTYNKNQDLLKSEHLKKLKEEKIERKNEELKDKVLDS